MSGKMRLKDLEVKSFIIRSDKVKSGGGAPYSFQGSCVTPCADPNPNFTLDCTEGICPQSGCCETRVYEGCNIQ